MAGYYVYWNTIRKRVQIHKAKCGACKDGEGMHKGTRASGRGDTYDWIAAESYQQASALATTSPPAKAGATIKDCGHCRPQTPN